MTWLPRQIQRLSLSTKVYLGVLVATFVALGIAAVVHIALEYLNFRPRLEAANSKLAQVVAANVSAAVVFMDTEAMHENLDAFSLIPEVRAARILGAEGNGLAQYVAPPFSSHEGFLTETTDQFLVETPIMVRGEQVGTLELVIGLDALSDSIRDFVTVAILALLLSIPPALATIRLMKPLILKPISQLGASMAHVTITRNYDGHVRKEVDDEFGTLVDQFNAMLDEIRRRDEHLARAASDMTAAKELAEAANAAKTKFIANMSHELRTPLNAIIGYAEMVVEDLEEDPKNEQQVADLQRILGAGRHLLGLINDVLDVAKIEAGRLEIHLVPTDLQSLLRDTVEAVRPTAAANGNDLKIAIDPQIGMATVDPVRLRQCLLNLLSNACKFTHSGTVTLRARLEGVDDTLLRLEVEDTGVGIEDANLAALFEPFVQIDSSMTRTYGGTGLGLAITRELVTAMSGTIGVTSSLGEGSVFTITLPLDNTTRPPKSLSPETSPSRRTSNKKLLVIEDSKDAAALLNRWLQPQRFDVIVAETGREGLSLARTLPADFIILDLDLPDISGWEVLSALRTDTAQVCCPVIALTVEEDRRRALDAGASELITKPAHKGDLLKLIDAYLKPDPHRIAVVADSDRLSKLGRVLERAGHETVALPPNAVRDADSFGVLDDLVIDGALFAGPIGCEIDARTLASSAKGAAVLWCGDSDAVAARCDASAPELRIARSEAELVLAVSGNHRD